MGKIEEKIATEIFNQYGLEFSAATRAGGWTNAVWLNGDLVLRLSLAQNSDRIRREVELAKMLPSNVGYPINVATGVTEGYEWSVSKRIQGKNLSEVWPKLSWEQRACAVRQIWEIMNAVHSVNLDRVITLAAKTPWYSSFNPTETVDHIKYYIEQGVFTPQQGAILSRMLERFWNALAAAPLVLNHGDMTTDNILWNDGKIVSLMDFEHSIVTAQQLDLNSFLNLAFFNEEGDPFSDEGDPVAFMRYKRETAKLFAPMLKEANCLDLLFGFIILFRGRFIDFWLEEPQGSIEELEPYKKLLSLTDGDGGFLAEFINL